MIDLPNMKLTEDQWEAISRKAIESARAAHASNIAKSNVIDLFTGKPVFVKPAN